MLHLLIFVRMFIVLLLCNSFALIYVLQVEFSPDRAHSRNILTAIEFTSLSSKVIEREETDLTNGVYENVLFKLYLDKIVINVIMIRRTTFIDNENSANLTLVLLSLQYINFDNPPQGDTRFDTWQCAICMY